MANKEKKIRKHPFYDRYTIPGAIALTFLGILISQLLVGGIIGGIFSLIAGGTALSLIVNQLGGILGAFVALAFFRKWFYPEYEGGFQGGQRVQFWSLIILPISAFTLIGSLIASGFSLGIPPVVNLIAAFTAGISEEAVFRGMSASYLMRQWVDRKKILPTLLVSSAIFGLFHGANILVGAPVGMTVVQIIFSFAMGLFLCALFLRSGSLIPPMILHTLHDIIAFMNVSQLQEGGAYKESATATMTDRAFELVLGIMFIALAIYLTRPAKQDEICTLWKKKWNKNVE